MIYGGHTYHLDDLGETVNRAVYDLKSHLNKFEFIVVTGVSGTIVGAPVAVALDIPLVVVRKTRNDCHDEQDVVNYAGALGRWLFLDDFLASGNTLRRVRERLSQPLKLDKPNGWSKPTPPKDVPVFAGCYMYDDRELGWATEESCELWPIPKVDYNYDAMVKRWRDVSGNSRQVGVW